MDLSVFKSNLKRLMESRGMNIREFSEATGIPSATISRYLQGLRTPELPLLMKIASYCNVSLDWLVGMSGTTYSVLPAEIQDIAECYSIASPDDRRVVQAVLSKYRKG